MAFIEWLMRDRERFRKDGPLASDVHVSNTGGKPKKKKPKSFKDALAEDGGHLLATPLCGSSDPVNTDAYTGERITTHFVRSNPVDPKEEKNVNVSATPSASPETSKDLPSWKGFYTFTHLDMLPAELPAARPAASLAGVEDAEADGNVRGEYNPMDEDAAAALAFKVIEMHSVRNQVPEETLADFPANVQAEVRAIEAEADQARDAQSPKLDPLHPAFGDDGKRLDQKKALAMVETDPRAQLLRSLSMSGDWTPWLARRFYRALRSPDMPEDIFHLLPKLRTPTYQGSPAPTNLRAMVMNLAQIGLNLRYEYTTTAQAPQFIKKKPYEALVSNY